MKCIVVGGGLAGMTAALRLFEKGLDVEVYEAKNRVGGRVYTRRKAHHIYELGGQNIYDGGEAKNLLKLAKDLDLETTKGSRVSNFRTKISDQIVDFETYIRSKKISVDTLEEIAKNSSNMQEVLQKICGDDFVLMTTISAKLSGYEGAAPNQLSTFYIETLYHILTGGLSAAHPGSQEEKVYLDFCWIKGGNDLICERIKEKLSGRVHLGQPLKSVRKSDQYHLTFETGHSALADIVILALPTTVYSDIYLKEVIPPTTLSTIESIVYGSNSKVLVPLYKKPSIEGQYTNGRLVAFFSGNLDLITLYYIGEFSRFKEESIPSFVEEDLKELEQIFDFEADRENMCGYSWPNDHYSKGSYSFIGAGQETQFLAEETIGSQRYKSLFKPVDLLYFAGEHTFILNEVTGTMESAVESGERIAKSILERIP